MSRMPMRITGMLILLTFLAAACVPGGGLPLASTPTARVDGATPPADDTVEPGATQTFTAPTPWDGADGPLPDAAAAARQLLADVLGLNTEDILIPTIEQADWPDACLGLPYAEEMCAEVITPGYRVVLEAGGETFEFRTDQTGANLRVAQGGGTLRELMVRAQLLVQQQVGELEDLRLVRFERVVFPDGCLGVIRPEMACLAAEVPGYILTLEAGGTPYEVRAAGDGSHMVFVPEGTQTVEPDPNATLPPITADFEALAENAILAYDREGGVAGLCDRLAVLPNGQVYATTCESAAVDVLTLSAEEMAFINGLLEQVGSFELEDSDAGTADALTTRLRGAGLGSVQVTTEQVEALRALLDVFLALQQ